jgi:hypothetical protein
MMKITSINKKLKLRWTVALEKSSLCHAIINATMYPDAKPFTHEFMISTKD